MAVQPERQTALEYANAFAGAPEDVVKRAEAYLAFLTGANVTPVKSAPKAKPTPTEVAPDATVAVDRAEIQKALDDAAASTAGPELTGDVEEDPTLSSDAGAASGSDTEQRSADAPDAGSSANAPDLTKVQAAVLAVNKAIGREQTVAILTAHGGARVPEIPVANHRALFDALNAKLPATDRIAE